MNALLLEELRKVATEAVQIGMGWVIPPLEPKTIYSVYPLGDDYLVAKFEDTVCAEFCAMAKPEAVIALLDALQSQAERIKELEATIGRNVEHYVAVTGELAQVRAKMVPLTPAQLNKLWLENYDEDYGYARAIEAAHGITGEPK